MRYCLFTLLIAGALGVNAQSVWTQKADLAAGPRTSAVGFSVGTGGYIGTGYDSTSFRRSFYVYNPASNIWTQVASLGGSTGSGLSRDLSSAFVIGTKAYICGGQGGNPYLNDVWEYNAGNDVWTQKANFAGTPRRGAVAFSIGNKGYYGTGQDATGMKKDFWEYDPASNTWTQKANFGGTGRRLAVGFAIGTKGYVGTGDDGANKNDFWEYDPAANTWSVKASFGGTPRSGAAGFVMNGKGYIGTGYDISLVNTNDVWEYTPWSNTWVQVASFGGTARANAVGFAIGNKGYIGTGYDGTVRSDFWEFSPLVGIEDENEKQQVSIYPNPLHTSASIMIAGAKPGASYTMSIYDLQGKKVREVEMNASMTLQREELSQGTYIYSISSETANVAAGRLVVVD
jgi:N-acetylneuraminic acid mutarotase